ncbi:MAG: methylenetetrahydrofolate reductase [NAD(P)H] [Betaproteobacteria bacterium]|jgi:methylenetetrahydrofolate reductase (NADPH)|nr:methylenetetrahydrofolate reductase [NAD(P)H] [Pseudomonadota bacterium]NBO03004.1 methylenetetrahydrofolate reductase [NAD(P)H] [Betaproteobacteria bacterium]HAB48174.1 methylenetetrahydrofolate reductase [NAD(P)H] [Lautropia sp.]NBO95215.1 methylenetetrahydrofolate reductase [NAD(P)H] [Betaproteobacteria bacterium]NBP34418.1 methylenetetrahydrofolate reductase [NAD(P)H] [Betaproteobacteria bacterium]
MSMALSFEFFPPNTDAGLEKLRQVRLELAKLKPQFFSVTYGAGGATRDKTLALVETMTGESIEVAPHLSCMGQQRSQLAELLDHYSALGIRRIVALRGDLPSGMVQGGEFRFAEDLVDFIRQRHGAQFHLEVAAYPEMHPQASSPDADLKAFIRKVRRGASSAITQYFYNADAYLRFRDTVRAEGVDIDIVPGIMPITNYTQLMRFSESCGAEIPRWMRLKLASYGDDRESIRAFGREVLVKMCERLLKESVPGLHFYTLNQDQASRAILDDLSLCS